VILYPYRRLCHLLNDIVKINTFYYTYTGATYQEHIKSSF